MTRLECSWMRDVLAAFAPPGLQLLPPRDVEVDYSATFHRMRAQATRKAAFGLRVAVLLVTMAPPLFGMGLRLFSHLRPRERASLLKQLLRHRWFAVRELTLLLKFTAAMALMSHEAVRARSGYDLVEAAAESDSGVRHRLPVLVEPASEAPGELA